MALLLASACPSAAQMESMPGMDMPPGNNTQSSEAKGASMPGMSMPSSGILGAYPMTRDSSGTSWQPDDSRHAAIHAMAGDWMLMGHLTLWGIYDTQSGPRGDEKAFVSGMLRGAPRRDLANGDTLNLRAM